MSDSTRRGFVKGSVAAAAGMTAIGALTAEAAQAREDAATGGVVAHVRDARTGEIDVMSADRTITVRDRKLASQIARAAR